MTFQILGGIVSGDAQQPEANSGQTAAVISSNDCSMSTPSAFKPQHDNLPIPCLGKYGLTSVIFFVNIVNEYYFSELLRFMGDEM